MKYFRERRRAGRPQTVPAEPSAVAAQVQGALDVGMPEGRPAEVGACQSTTRDITTINDAEVQNSLESIIGPRAGKSRERCRERLLRARRRRDIRLSRKEVSCLQLLVQNVLNEHLALSRELQTAYERMGLPVDSPPADGTPREVTPLARNVWRLQSVLERDAARLKAALQEREERLEGAMADADALRSEIQTWRRISTEEAEKSKIDFEAALAERDGALNDAVAKDQVISNLRSELASLESKRSTEALSMSRALTEKEVYITNLQAQAQERMAEIDELRQLHENIVTEMEYERAVRVSTEEDLGVAKRDLGDTVEEHERLVLMLCRVISDKEAEIDDLGKQMDEVKSRSGCEITEMRREAEARLAEVQQSGQRAIARKAAEVNTMEGTLKETKQQIRRLKSDLELERHKISELHGELASARTEIATTTETAASATRRVAELDAHLAEERQRHEHDVQTQKSALENQLKALRIEATKMQENFHKQLADQRDTAADERDKLENQLSEAQEELKKAEDIASRTPSLMSELKKASEELSFLEERVVEQNTELATTKRENRELAGEIEMLKNELNSLQMKNEEHLDEIKKKTEKEASDFRKALHEKDVEIREHQDQLKQLQEDGKRAKESLTSAQKALKDSEQQHRSNLQNAKCSHREAQKRLKTEVTERSDEVKRQEEQIKNLQSKLQEQRSQFSHETDKLNTKMKTFENAKCSVEKKLREAESLLKDSEAAREKLLHELSSVVANNATIKRELEGIREELKTAISNLEHERRLSLRLSNELAEAKAEAKFALDIVGDFETWMVSIYAETVKGKCNIQHSELKISQMAEEFENISNVANKEIEKQKDDYRRLKVRFIKYIKLREGELKAAGDSAEQNGAEAKRYLHQLHNSNTELETTSARCKSLQQELQEARVRIEDLSNEKTAFMEQALQNKELLALTEDEVKLLRTNLENQNKGLFELRLTLSDKEIDIERLSADLAEERSNVALLTQRETKIVELIAQNRKLPSQTEADFRDPKGNFEHGKSLSDLRIVFAQKESEIEALTTALSEEKSNSAILEQKQSELARLTEENKKTILLKEIVITELKDALERQRGDVLELKTILSRKVSDMETLSSDLSREQSNLVLSVRRESELNSELEENKNAPFRAEAEERSLETYCSEQNSSDLELTSMLSDRESELKTVCSTDLSKEEANSSKQLSEYEAAFSLIETSSKQWISKRLNFDPSLGLTDRIYLLLQTIYNLEKELNDANLSSKCTEEENVGLKEKLASTLTEIKNLTSVRDHLKTCTTEAEKIIIDLQCNLKELRLKCSKQESYITELETKLSETERTVSVAMKAKENMIQQVEEVKELLTNAKLEMEELRTQIEHEKEKDLDEARSQTELCRQEPTKHITESQTQEETIAESIQEHGKEVAHLRTLLEQAHEEHGKEVAHLRTLLEQVHQVHGKEVSHLQTLLEQAHQEHGKEVSHLQTLLEQAHQEHERKTRDSADGDGNKDTLTDGLKYLRAALAENDVDVVKLQSVVVDLQNELSLSKSSADSEAAQYRVTVEELTKEIAELKSELEERKHGAALESDGDMGEFDLHSTEEQTMLVSGKDVSRHSARKRRGTGLKRTSSGKS